MLNNPIITIIQSEILALNGGRGLCAQFLLIQEKLEHRLWEFYSNFSIFSEKFLGFPKYKIIQIRTILKWH